MALSVSVYGINTQTGVQTAGRFGTANITTKTGLPVAVYTVPENQTLLYSMAAVSITNRDVDSADNVYIAVSQGSVPAPKHYIEWSASLVPSGTLERTQMVLDPGDVVFVQWGNAPAQLITESEDPTGASWSASATGTGTFDVTKPGEISYDLAEGDTGELRTSSFTLVDGNTYRAVVAFESTEITGENSSIQLEAWDGVTAQTLITLSQLQRDRTDRAASYTVDFTVDNAGAITDQYTSLRLQLADVNATIDRISLQQIA